MKHYINIENGVLKLMRTMPNEDDHKYWSEDHWKDIFHKDLFDQALTQAKADSVEIADQNYAWGQVVYEVEKSSGPRPTLRSDLEGKIIEITTNGVFEVREQFRVRDKSIWIDGVTENQRDKTFLEFRQLAYYSDEPKGEEPTASQVKLEPKIVNEFLDASQFKGGDRINHYLVQALRQLDSNEMIELAKALLSRSQPASEDGESQEELVCEIIDMLGGFSIDRHKILERFTIQRKPK